MDEEAQKVTRRALQPSQQNREGALPAAAANVLADALDFDRVFDSTSSLAALA